MAQKFYAVKNGKQTGIFLSWDECKTRVHGYPGALYKSFPSMAEAEAYLAGGEKASSVEDARCHIYVDGSYVNGKYGWGFAVYEGQKLAYTENGMGKDEAAAKLRNVAGEIEATIQAVEWARKNRISRIAIHHDYIGISEWAEKRWKTNNDVTQNYARYMEAHLGWITFVKVAGHSGDPGNELADKLAKQALGIL